MLIFPDDELCKESRTESVLRGCAARLTSAVFSPRGKQFCWLRTEGLQHKFLASRNNRREQLNVPCKPSHLVQPASGLLTLDYASDHPDLTRSYSGGSRGISHTAFV